MDYRRGWIVVRYLSAVVAMVLGNLLLWACWQQQGELVLLFGGLACWGIAFVVKPRHSDIEWMGIWARGLDALIELPVQGVIAMLRALALALRAVAALRGDG